MGFRPTYIDIRGPEDLVLWMPSAVSEGIVLLIRLHAELRTQPSNPGQLSCGAASLICGVMCLDGNT